MVNFLRKSEGTKELKPYFDKERPPCPFYGFHAWQSMFMDQTGNQCALLIDSYSPCQMEVRNQKTDWNKCPFNTPETRQKLEEISQEVIVFPNEFWPPGQKSFRDGIPLRDWIEYVMKEKE